MDLNFKPRLRPITAFPIETEKGRLVVLKDATGISQELLTVNETLLFVLQFFDGNHTTLDIKTNFFRATGTFLYDEQIEQIVAKLDEAHLLEGENFERYISSIMEEYRKSKTRKPAHAGSGYPADTAELRKYLAGFFDWQQSEETGRQSHGRVAGMIVPHLDLRLAGRLYAKAYSKLKRQDVSTFIILGTAHTGSRNGYILSRKDFETPLGTVKCDTELASKITEASALDITEDEFHHRCEHSIEFQTLFLKYIFQDLDIRIVPILCSFNFKELNYHPDPSIRAFLSEFPLILRDIVNNHRKDAVYIASVDLAHIGQRYGDRFAITQEFLTELREKDAEMLKLIETINTTGFIEFIEREDDRRRICGFAPITALLAALGQGVLAEHLGYEIFSMGSDGSYVSAVSMIFKYEN